MDDEVTLKIENERVSVQEESISPQPIKWGNLPLDGSDSTTVFYKLDEKLPEWIERSECTVDFFQATECSTNSYPISGKEYSLSTPYTISFDCVGCDQKFSREIKQNPVSTFDCPLCGAAYTYDVSALFNGDESE